MPKRISTTFTNVIIQLAKQKKYLGCNAGRNLFVDTDGKLYPCHMFCKEDSFVMGDLIQEQFHLDEMKKMTTINRFQSDTCINCISKNVCSYWCKGIQYVSYKDMYQVSPIRCIFQNAILKEAIKGYSRWYQQKDKVFFKNLVELCKGVEV